MSGATAANPQHSGIAGKLKGSGLAEFSMCLTLLLLRVYIWKAATFRTCWDQVSWCGPETAAEGQGTIGCKAVRKSAFELSVLSDE